MPTSRNIMTMVSFLVLPILLILQNTSHGVYGFSPVNPLRSRNSQVMEATGFQRQPPSSIPAISTRTRQDPIRLLFARKDNHPEFSIVDKEDSDNDDLESYVSLRESSSSVSQRSEQTREASPSENETEENENRQQRPTSMARPEYMALTPGTVVNIQVHDTHRARKAWKKRRRSGSPLLVPCSVLSVDRPSALRWNMLYLLQKFGYCSSATKKKNKLPAEIRISLQELASRSRTHLRSSLYQHAAALGFLEDSPNDDDDKPGSTATGSVPDLVQNLLNDQMQLSYGVELVVDQDDNWKNWYLRAPISRFRARQRAQEAAILQFSVESGDGGGDEKSSLDGQMTLQHTGTVRNKRVIKDDNDENNKNMYQMQPLSTALRVSRDELDNGLVQNDGLYSAVVFDYDLTGDAGTPLLVLSLNPPRSTREGLKLSSSSSLSNELKSSADNSGVEHYKSETRHLFNDLQIGSGPLRGKVLRLIKGGALVDCGVCRSSKTTTSDGKEDGEVPVLAFLRFKDAVELPTVDKENEFDDVDDEDEPVMEEGDWQDILSFDELDKDDDSDDEDVNEAPLDRKTNSPRDLGDLSAIVEEFEKEEEGEDHIIDSEDITHLFELNEDGGGYTFTDPETGLSQVILNDGFDDDLGDDNTAESDREDSESDDGPVVLDRPISKRARTTNKRRRPSKDTVLPGARGLKRKMLKVGDVVDVYVSSSSKQSLQLNVTMNPNDVCGFSAREVKKKKDVNKKLNRLAKQLSIAHPDSGSSLYDSMQYWKGREMNGVVKAASQTGDWFYVQPRHDDDDDDGTFTPCDLLPVGVASFDGSSTDASDKEANDGIAADSLQRGDPVRIRVQGIDKDRGQLALRILEKLKP